MVETMVETMEISMLLAAASRPAPGPETPAPYQRGADPST